MNVYAKYCPNVYVAKCTEKHEKGDTINVETKYGKENECIVHNLVLEHEGFFYYSIERADGFNSQERAKRRVERLESFAENADKKSESYYTASNKHADFLSLGEPIKVGHHSEARHRKMIESANSNMEKSVESSNKASDYRARKEYWEKLAEKIDLSMPDCIEYFKWKLDEAIAEHEGVKNGTIPRSHSYSLTYAKKTRNEAEKNYRAAISLWG
jgi:hypothetical protein